MIAIVSFQVDDESGSRIYLQCRENGVLYGYPSVQNALEEIAEKYQEKSSLSLTWSTGCLLHWMQFKQKVHEVDPQNLKALYDQGIIFPEARIQTIRAEGGRMTGILCEGPNAQAWHDTGINVSMFTTV